MRLSPRFYFRTVAVRQGIAPTSRRDFFHAHPILSVRSRGRADADPAAGDASRRLRDRDSDGRKKPPLPYLDSIRSEYQSRPTTERIPQRPRKLRSAATWIAPCHQGKATGGASGATGMSSSSSSIFGQADIGDLRSG